MNKNKNKILSPYELEEYANGGDFFNIMKSAAPLVSLIPGVGTIAGPIMSGVGAIGGVVSNNMTQQDQVAAQQQQQQRQVFNQNLDPRYLQGYATGGNIVEMPTTNASVDSIPTDAQGNPTSISGREAIAMTDSGEVIWNGYVFSDKLGFSNKAKTVLKRYKLRLGDDFSGKDRISKEQMNRELADLADEQELYKYHNGINDSSEGYASGGGIHIKESKVGTFTAAANRRGMGVQEFANQVMSNKEKYSPDLVRKANFAKNSASWNHKLDGGPIDELTFQDPDEPSLYEALSRLSEPMSTTEFVKDILANSGKYSPDLVKQAVKWDADTKTTIKKWRASIPEVTFTTPDKYMSVIDSIYKLNKNKYIGLSDSDLIKQFDLDTRDVLDGRPDSQKGIDQRTYLQSIKSTVPSGNYMQNTNVPISKQLGQVDVYGPKIAINTHEYQIPYPSLAKQYIPSRSLSNPIVPLESHGVEFPETRTLASSDMEYQLENREQDNTYDPDLMALFSNLGTAGLQGLIGYMSRQKDFTPTTYSPELLNLSGERDELNRNATMNRRMMLNRYRNSRSAQIAGITATNDQLSGGMSRSYVNEGQYNAQAKNTQRQLFAQSSERMKEAREAERGAVATNLSNMVGNAGASVNQYFTDRSKRQRDLEMQRIIASGSNYGYVYSPDWRIVDINIKPQITH